MRPTSSANHSVVRGLNSSDQAVKSDKTNLGESVTSAVNTLKTFHAPNLRESLSEMVKQANTPQYLNQHGAKNVTIIDSLDSMSRKAQHNKGPAPQPPKGESLSKMVKQANTPQYLNQHRAKNVTIIDSLDSMSRKAQHNKGSAPQPPKL